MTIDHDLTSVVLAIKIIEQELHQGRLAPTRLADNSIVLVLGKLIRKILKESLVAQLQTEMFKINPINRFGQILSGLRFFLSQLSIKIILNILDRAHEIFVIDKKLQRSEDKVQKLNTGNQSPNGQRPLADKPNPQRHTKYLRQKAKEHHQSHSTLLSRIIAFSGLLKVAVAARQVLNHPFLDLQKFDLLKAFQKIGDLLQKVIAFLSEIRCRLAHQYPWNL